MILFGYSQAPSKIFYYWYWKTHCMIKHLIEYKRQFHMTQLRRAFGPIVYLYLIFVDYTLVTNDDMIVC